VKKKEKLLTKSRFKMAHECATKLYYTNRKDYGNTKTDDSFLKSLAEGGFQVGELAKLYFEDGHEISSLDYEEAISETNRLMRNESVVIYEAAFRFESLFVRVDILRKTGNEVELVEVKAKSINTEESDFYKKKTRELNSDWEPYLLDVAFQTHVAKNSYSQLNFVPFLMLADKLSVATVDGLNQNFILENKDGRTRARCKERLNSKRLGAQILKQIDVSKEVEFINKEYKHGGKGFVELIQHYSTIYSNDEQYFEDVGGKCKSCEYRIGANLKDSGFKSGFEECWKKKLNLDSKDFQKAFAFEIWNSRKTDDFLARNIIFMDQVKEGDLLPKGKAKDTDGLNTSQRQWLQVSKELKKDIYDKKYKFVYITPETAIKSETFFINLNEKLNLITPYSKYFSISYYSK
jgi:hypothetical protein